MTAEVLKDIEEADLVLVGIGDECDSSLKPYLKMEVQEALKEIKKETRQRKKRLEFYNKLEKLLENKDYFVVSTCLDGIIEESNLNQERIVEPCGSINKLQCEDNCSEEVYAFEPEEIVGERICPKCKKKLVFNTVALDNYEEAGYMPQWNIYSKWLQTTINKKLCVLEFGVSMNYPTVIRWAFEKVVFFNQKSKMYRIHSFLYQSAAEVKDRCTGIQAEALDFLN